MNEAKTSTISFEFNKVRERLAINYNRLVRKLNEGIDGNSHPVQCVEVELKQIEQTMIDLRRDIIIITMAHEEGREDFKDVLLDHDIEIFNPCSYGDDEDE